MDPHVVGLFRQIYANSTTHVEARGGVTPDIKVRVGVKQGDPMSPLLFNLAMDPLIHGLECFSQGYTVAGHSVVAIGFADDLVLDHGHNLGLLDVFCQSPYHVCRLCGFLSVFAGL